MLEVVFSDSAKGSMKIAKTYNKENVLDGVLYLGKKPSKKELEKQFEGKAIGGDSRDVVCIGFSLDVGDITDEMDVEKRKNEFVRLFSSVIFDDQEIERYFRSQQEDFDKLLTATRSGEPIRVWKSDAPYSACGFAFLCDVLENIMCEISVISLPECWEMYNGTIRWYRDWGEIMPGQLHQFLPLERVLSDGEKRLQSSLWKELKTENAPLRALVNGRLVSVPEDFYDHLIIRNIPEQEFVMVRLIGEILGKYPLGVGDGWYALRIKKMITENKLAFVAVTDDSHPYGKVLKKV